MTLSDILHMLRRQMWWVIGATLVCLAVAAAVALASPKTYQGSTTLYITASDSKDAAALSQGAEYVQSQIRSYPLIVTSPSIAQPVSRETGLPANQLGSHVTATVPTDSSLLQIDVTADSPDAAKALAASVGKNFSTQIVDLEKRPGASQSPIQVTTIEPAWSNPSPIEPKTRIILLLGLVGGLVLGALVGAVRELSARR